HLAEQALELARSFNSPLAVVAEACVEHAGSDIVRVPRDPQPCSCSFCGAPHSGGNRFVAGPQVFICKSCVDAFVEQLALRSHGQQETQDMRCSFCNRPPIDVTTLLVSG